MVIYMVTQMKHLLSIKNVLYLDDYDYKVLSIIVESIHFNNPSGGLT